MAVRYTNTIANNQGLFYRVDILDNAYSGSEQKFIGVDFEYKRKELTNRWDSMWGSEVMVTAKSNSVFDIDTLIDDIRDAEEGRFNLALYKSTDGVSFDFEWIGIILNDLSGGMDEFITTYTITATDGLGALKGIDFNVNDTTPLSTSSASFALQYALRKLPYNSFFGTDDIFMKTYVVYYESQMASMSSDSLNYTTIPQTTFYDIDENGVYTWDSCYEVIEKICQLFGCRIFFGGGAWRIVDIRAWETASSLDFWIYKLALDGQVNESIRYTIDGTNTGARIATQAFDNFAPLKKLERYYQHDSARNLVQGITINTANGLQTVQTDIPETGDESLGFNGVIQFNAVETAATGTTQQVFVKLRFTVKYGSYYLKRTVTNQTQNADYTSLTWESSSSYIEYIGVFNVQYLGGMYLAVNFESPALPDVGPADLEVNLEKVYIQDLQQNDLSGSYTYSATFGSIYIEYIDGNDAENKRKYYVENNTSSFYSDTEELKTLNVGDKINPMTQNRLQVFNGTTNVDSLGNWGRNVLSGTTALIPLVLEDFMSGQRSAVKKRQGQFIGAFDNWKVLIVDSETYLPIGVRQSIKKGLFDGVWYKSGVYDDSGLAADVTIDPLSVDSPPSPPSVTPPGGGGAPPQPVGIQMDNGALVVQDVAGGTPLTVQDSDDLDVFTVNGDGDVVGNTFNEFRMEKNGNSLTVDSINTSNTGSNCVGFGVGALRSNSGNNCAAFGFQALQNNTGANNIGIGVQALQNATRGDSVGIGHRALQNTTGISTVGIGFQALRDSDADYTVAIGNDALRYTASTGSYLTAIGYKAAEGTSGTPLDFDNSTALGANSTITSDNQFQFGDGSVDNFVFGQDMELDIDSNWYSFSDGTNDLLKIGKSNKIVQINGGLVLAAAIPAASAVNGMIYEDDSDNKLYYKNSLGVVTALT